MIPLISIVIPVYKVEKYLIKCVDSVVNQTYKNLEIILVDDGSPDNCGKICDEYARIDKRIIVIHKENGGLSSARNAGIEICKGDYLFFIDSDDWISDDCIEYLYNSIFADDSDCAVTNLMFINEETGKARKVYNFEEKHFVFRKNEAIKTMFYQKNISCGAPGKLYKKQLFKDIRYPESTLFEDLATTYRIFDKCERITVNSEDKYYYLQRKSGIIRSKFTDRKLDIINITEEIVEYIQEKLPVCYKAAVCRLISGQLHVYFQIPKNDSKYKVIRLKIENNEKNIERLFCLIKMREEKQSLPVLFLYFLSQY